VPKADLAALRRRLAATRWPDKETVADESQGVQRAKLQWRVENVHIVPVFGKGALNASPRLGHLHVQVDDLPWWWADPSNVNTIDIAGMSPGPHKVKISLVNANHAVFPGQSKTVRFTIPNGASHSH
jgi:hypothetical protein